VGKTRVRLAPEYAEANPRGLRLRPDLEIATFCG
jgi:hypothetical protein